MGKQGRGRKRKKGVWVFFGNSKELPSEDVRHSYKCALPAHNSEIVKKRFVSGTTFVWMTPQRTDVEGQVILADRKLSRNCVVPNNEKLNSVGC